MELQYERMDVNVLIDTIRNADDTFTLSDNIEGLIDLSAKRNQEQVYDLVNIVNIKLIYFLNPLTSKQSADSNNMILI